MRIAILGAGAMGQLFGALLIDDGNDVVLIDASQPTINALNEQGITVKTSSSHTRTPANAALAADVEGPIELLLVFTKGLHTAAAVDSVRHLLTADTLGLTLQNGLGNERVLLKVFGPTHTLVGITDFPAHRLEETVIGSADVGHVVLGDAIPRTPISPAAIAVADVLDQTGLHTVTHPDVRKPVWEKLIFNSVVNTIGAATGMTVGQTGTAPAARQLVESVLTEALAVAHAYGVKADSNRIRSLLETTFVDHADHKTSMTADVEAGRETEINTIGGAVEATGRNTGTPTPVLSTLCDVVRLRSLP